MRRRIVLIAICVVLGSCSPAENEAASTTSLPPSTTSTSGPASTSTTGLPALALASPAFGDGEAIPVDYTCDGEDISPELNLVGLPVGTKTLTIVVEDPDAPLGVWYHWVEFDVRADSGSYTFSRDTAQVGTPGVNSWNLEGYMGPCPPSGEEHDYVFRVYALSQPIDLPAGVSADEVIAAMGEHVLDTVDLTGNYAR